MKANELMIGDWVRVRLPWRSPVDGHIENRWYMRRVMGIRTNGKNSNKFYLYFEPWGVLPHDIEPLPLTSKILEKNGFEPDTTEDAYKYCYLIDDVSIVECYANAEGRYRGIVSFGDTRLRMTLMFVHELQHALRLCGINKQIEL